MVGVEIRTPMNNASDVDYMRSRLDSWDPPNERHSEFEGFEIAVMPPFDRYNQTTRRIEGGRINVIERFVTEHRQRAYDRAHDNTGVVVN